MIVQMFRVVLVAFTFVLVIALTTGPAPAQEATTDGTGAIVVTNGMNANCKPEDWLCQTVSRGPNGQGLTWIDFETNPYVFWVYLVVVAVYLMTILFLRYIWVVEPANAQINARRNIILARSMIMPVEESHGDSRRQDLLVKEAVAKLIADSVEYVPKLDKNSLKNFFQQFFASGKQLAAWSVLHDAERYLFMDREYSRQFARSYGLMALGKLNRIPDAPMRLKLELMKALSADDSRAHNNGDLPPNLIPLVREARAFIHTNEDETFARIADAKNKGLMLLFFAVSSLTVLVFLFPETLLLAIAGTIGGVLSRLRKALANEAPVFDLGLSWTVIFLTPVVGALTGWFGVLFVEALRIWNVLGASLAPVSINDPTGWSMLFAFAFGWSTTLFDSFISRIEDRLGHGREEAEQVQELEAVIGQTAKSDESNKQMQKQMNELTEKVQTITPGKVSDGDANGNGKPSG